MYIVQCVILCIMILFPARTTGRKRDKYYGEGSTKSYDVRPPIAVRIFCLRPNSCPPADSACAGVRSRIDGSSQTVVADDK